MAPRNSRHVRVCYCFVVGNESRISQSTDCKLDDMDSTLLLAPLSSCFASSVIRVVSPHTAVLRRDGHRGQLHQ